MLFNTLPFLSKMVLRIVILSFVLQLVPVKSQDKPKLFIGLVVDQMRQEYLVRYQGHFGEGGFKRLMNKGFTFQNHHYNYMPTYTAPGHASIYTGTTPAVHGIVANTWFDKKRQQSHYCVNDNSFNTVGDSSTAGKKSATPLKSSTIGDELKVASAGKSKVFAVALKDRSAILPAGHAADGAFWYSNTGKFISSTYYMKELPTWLSNFNNQEHPKALLKKNWELINKKGAYTNSTQDDHPGEGVLDHEDNSFPHDLIKSSQNLENLGVIKACPQGNTLTRLIAESLIKNENLGKDEFCDFLSISFSSIDYIGHAFGPNSIEMEDAIIRLDKELEAFLTFLDLSVGENQYTLFLTADHGALQVPTLLKEYQIPSGLFNHDLRSDLNKYLTKELGVNNLILAVQNHQVFFNSEAIDSSNVDYKQLSALVSNYVYKLDGVYKILNKENLLIESYSNGLNALVQKGFHPQMSGDLWIILEPGWISHERTGTTHGSPFNYDTHVPLIWYGAGIKTGSSTDRVYITDIAPTSSFLIGSPQPNSTEGNILPIVKN